MMSALSMSVLPSAQDYLAPNATPDSQPILTDCQRLRDMHFQLGQLCSGLTFDDERRHELHEMMDTVADIYAVLHAIAQESQAYARRNRGGVLPAEAGAPAER